ncbi:hypothetical protein [Cupriavidus pauculus]|uniref:hypothetical protein n=1 Tax=Cupriavidus pauculus TaxID=82633 RepID=UPI001FD083FD|nr:hypothetical protein [Cupriavidus pauculus]
MAPSFKFTMSLFNVIRQMADALADKFGQVPANARKIVVGTGADNEYQISIDGIPHLFRDEGDHVVHFVAVFDSCIQNTTFGHKVLPDVVPRWENVGIERGRHVTPQSVAEAVIQSSKAKRKAAGPESRSRIGRNIAPIAEGVPDAEQAPPRDATASDAGYTVGRLIEWGEMKFPNRKPGGKPTYTSFAVRLDTANGQKTLQGEGLKEPLANLGCQIGDEVGIKRLHKEKVPAFDHLTGRPIIDPVTRKQKLYDRWVWRMHRIH